MWIRLGLVAGVLAVGCGTEPDIYDPFPVSVDLTSGPVLVSVSGGTTSERYVAALDTLSPITLIDSHKPSEWDPEAGAEPEPLRRQIDLLVYDQSAPPVPRWRFRKVSVVDVHPCPELDRACEIGLGSARSPISAVLGADLLSRGAVRLEIPDSSIRFFPDIAGEDSDRGRECEAVFEQPFAGGGTVRISGAEIEYGARRLAIGACLHHDPLAQKEAARGADALLVLSTGLGITVISNSAYDRYAELVTGLREEELPPPRDSLPITDLYLPSGRIEVRLGSITRMALVGEGSDKRGPCKELHANYLMSAQGCDASDPHVEPCPCSDGRSFCSTAAAIELNRTMAVAIVPDLDPLLQALRQELRPAYPEVDGLLGVNAIAPLEIDLDYPNDRVIARCREAPEDCEEPICLARPAVRNRATVEEIDACPCIP